MGLQVLIIEDNESDAKLVARELNRAGLAPAWKRIATREELAEALATGTWDVILSDWSLPGFSGVDALQVLVAARVDVPFIIVTGTIDEATAVEAMRAGAKDVVVKSRLARLAPAVERELRDRDVRRSQHIAKRALALSEARFARLSESGIIGIALADSHGRVHDANHAYCQMLGYSLAEMRAGEFDWTARTPAEWAGLDAIAAAQLAATGVAKPWEKELIHRDGHHVPVLVGVAMLDNEDCIAFVTDLTEQKKAEVALRSTEEQLRQAQKLEAIGSLAGGIAHDFNNLLSVIVSYVAFALEDLHEGDPLRADMLEVAQASSRAVDLTRQLLAFSRRQMLQPRVLDLDKVLHGMERMLRRLIGEDIDLSLRLHGAAHVLLDPTQIEQVVMNLVINARDAMPNGGKLAIETSVVALDEQLAREHGCATGDVRVALSVTDTGCGMDVETRSRIFEPFFTTKEPGRGTGLGLSTVHGIVKQSGGSISVDTTPGVGTVFRLLFAPVAAPADETAVQSADGSLRGTETILLVEDDRALRQLAHSLLERRGYQVLEAESPGDALLLAESHDGPIHLLLTDIVMPRMSGRALAERLCAQRAGLPVLYMSGYTDDEVLRRGVLRSEVSFLQKPFSPDSLGRAVRQAIDRSQRDTR